MPPIRLSAVGSLGFTASIDTNIVAAAEEAGSIAIEVWPYSTAASGQAYIPLTLPQGIMLPSTPISVVVAGVPRAAGLLSTSTHGDGSLRSGCLRVALGATVKDTIQAGSVEIGVAGATQSWVAPVFRTTAPGVGVEIKDIDPMTNANAVGGMTNAVTMCNSKVLGPLLPVAQNPAITGLTQYESEFNRILPDLIEPDLARKVAGIDRDVFDSPIGSPSMQYDRLSMCMQRHTTTGVVRWLARGVQHWSCLRQYGLAISGPGPWWWGEPYMGWESQNHLFPLLFGGDASAITAEADIAAAQIMNTGSLFWSSSAQSVQPDFNSAGARYVAHFAQRMAFIAHRGETGVVNGRTPREWARDWVVRLLGSDAWSFPVAGQARYRTRWTGDAVAFTLPFWDSTLMYAMTRCIDLGNLALNRAAAVTRLREWLEYQWTLWRTSPPDGSGVPRFWYFDPDNNNENEPFAADLNLMFLHNYYWMFRETGNTVWRDRGDTILASTVANVNTRNFLGGGPDTNRQKVVQEAFTYSQRGIAMRQGVTG
jgi:hypothetical protein